MDCSQGSPWCYTVLSPPPPLGFFSDDTSSGPNLSPLVIALIGILASALLLASYYLLISRYCGGLGSFRWRMGQYDGRGFTDEGSDALRGDAWQQAPPAAAGGLEEWVIRRIAVCRYKKGDGLVESSDCSVCLGEFRDGESLRLLPDCLHAFHVSCIDTWLKSNSSCPLCRANIVYTFAAPSPSPPPRPTPPPPRSTPPIPEIRHDAEVAQDAERGRGGEESRGLERSGVPVRKGTPRMHGELRGVDGGHGSIELAEEGIQPDEPRQSFASVADVLRMSSEGGPSAARNGGVMVEEVGSSRGSRAEQHAYKVGVGDGVLHCVMSPAPPVKRSFAGGRFCFAGQGRGNNGSILPL